MAFQDVNVANFKKASDLAVGDSLTAFVVRFEQSSKYPDQTNMVMQDEAGNQFVLLSSGNIKYLIKDRKIKQGLLTKITRQPDTKIKGMKSTVYQVLQDGEQTLEQDSFAAITSTIDSGSGSAETAIASNVVNAVERNIKAQAAKLTNSMKRG